MRVFPVAVLVAGIMGSASPIITRHDVSDRAFLNLAKELPVAKAVQVRTRADRAATKVAMA